jgi:hypothetical protein
MKPIEIASGSVFGRLTVVRRVENHACGEVQYQCLCSCGAVTVVRSLLLRHGRTRSCGCLVRENKGSPPKHGMCNTGAYRSWAQMKSRCSNPRHHAYASYGGRGITVCDRWQSFEAFLADMGDRPKGMTLDRYPDVNGNYELANCRWATPREQQGNRRVNRILTIDGESKTIADWARTLNAPRSRIIHCLNSGIDIKAFCENKPATHLRRKLVKVA